MFRGSLVIALEILDLDRLRDDLGTGGPTQRAMLNVVGIAQDDHILIATDLSLN